MARRRRKQQSLNAGWHDRRHIAEAATQPAEGQMVGDKNELNDEELARIWVRYQEKHGAGADADWEKLRYDADNPRYKSVLQQKIRLKGNGVEMDFGSVRAGLVLLRELQANEPDQFVELVRSVRPRGATNLPEPSFQMAIARGGLKEFGFLQFNGRVTAGYAKILDAAYTETKEGVVLRDPVVPPSREFVEELIAAEREVDSQLISSNRLSTANERRKKRGKGDGTAR